VEFSLTEEQASLRDSVGRFVSESHDFAKARSIGSSDDGFSREHWAAFADLGWLALLVPQELGGIGASIEDAAIVMEEFGKGLVAAPFISTAVLAVEILDRCADFASRATELAKIAAGHSLIALASEEQHSRYELSTIATSARPLADGNYALTGRKMAVLDGACANAFIVSAELLSASQRGSGLALFLVPAEAPGLEIRRFRMIDGRRAAHLVFDDVRVSQTSLMAEPATALQVLSRSVDEARVLLAAEALGAMNAAMELTAQHLKTRRQFGRPLASFQVLTHQLANMFVRLENSRSLVLRAMASLHFAPGERAAAVSATLVSVIQAGEFVGGQAIQLHGGIGMAEENAVGHYYKRLRAIGKSYGDQSFHMNRYLGLAGNRLAPCPEHLRQDGSRRRDGSAVP
jgi:alkylation response protein AidB-like acyl-CoA dehydrogenase